MKTLLVRFAALSMAIALILGALGAHFLKEKLPPDSLESFETGVRYQLVHSIALLVLTALINFWEPKTFRVAAALMILGIILFSGSIYLLSTQSITGVTFSVLGPVTPLGGLCMIASWFVLGFGIKLKP